MKNIILRLFIIIVIVGILNGCNNAELSNKIVENELQEEVQQEALVDTVEIIDEIIDESEPSSMSEYFTDEQVMLLENAITYLWDRSGEKQEVTIRDLSDSDCISWLYSYFLNGLFTYEFLDYPYEEKECDLIIEGRYVKQVSEGFLGINAVDIEVGDNSNWFYHDKDNDNWKFAIASGEPQPSGTICNIQSIDDIQVIITGYVQNGYCLEYTYTYDPLYKFRAVAVINSGSIFGCKLDQITYGIEDSAINIKASSELTDEYATYYANNILDNNFTTAWVPDNKGDANGEYVMLDLDGEQILYGFAIANGYMKSVSTYQNNGKVNKIKLEFDDVELEYELSIPDMDEDLECYTDTTSYTDIFYFDEPIKTSTVKMILVETEPGSKYNDICISDISILY